MRRVLVLAATASVVAALLSGCGSDGGGAAAPAGSGAPATAAVGAPLPPLDLVTLDGRPTTLDLGGKPAVVNLWATWCAPCLTEMPAIEAAHQQLGDAVTVVGVNVGDDAGAAREMAATTGVTYDLVVDPSGRALTTLGAAGLPRTLFVAADGTVTSIHDGAITTDEVLASVGG